MTDYPKYPSELARKNQEVIAERRRWPLGALHACRDLENRFPGWRVHWLAENPFAGFERPAGYWATYDAPPHEVEIFREDPQELAERLEEGVPEHDYNLGGCSWCLAHLGVRRVKL